MSGKCRRSSLTTVLLPTPEGPDSTVSRRPDPSSKSAPAVKFPLEGRDLVVAEPAHAAALGDADPLHHLAGPDLAQPRHRLQQVEHLHLADDLVLLALTQHVGERGTGVLEPVLDLRALAPRGGGLLEGSLPLLGGE